MSEDTARIHNEQQMAEYLAGLKRKRLVEVAATIPSEETLREYCQKAFGKDFHSKAAIHSFQDHVTFFRKLNGEKESEAVDSPLKIWLVWKMKGIHSDTPVYDLVAVCNSMVDVNKQCLDETYFYLETEMGGQIPSGLALLERSTFPRIEEAFA